MSPLLVMLFCVSGFAQEYVIQNGDRLNITFWQEPTLNTVSKVGLDGKIDLPVIGRTKAAGLSAIRLGNEIVEKIARYRIKITQASVEVVEYAKNKLYITGQVGSPGTYSFERIPNLWKTIQEAGGFLETANLEKVTIIRAGNGSGLVTHVDMNKYFENNSVNRLPRLRGGDTIHVPTLPSIRVNSSAPSTPFTVRNEIYILGEVVSPGKYNLEKNINLLDAIILAGGPTNSAKLSQVRILKRWQDKSGMMKFNLEKYLNDSEPSPPNLFPGDTIFVPRKKLAGSFIFSRILLPVISSASVLLIVNLLR